MPSQRVTFRGSRADLRRFLAKVPRVLATAAGAPELARGLQLRLGVALLSRVQQAFLVKSRGGVGDDGVRWRPLARATVAGRRTSPAERKALGVGGRRVRGLLTPAQDRRWRQLFARRKNHLMAKFGMDPAAAAALAAKLAWGVLKGEGARTRLAVLGGRQVDICRDTSRYFQSLSPGVEDRPSGAEGQVFELRPGRVLVGTDVPYAARQHAMRPLWPADGQLPPAWWDALLEVAQRGLLRGLALILVQGNVA
jgi:hypothetical protein